MTANISLVHFFYSFFSRHGCRRSNNDASSAKFLSSIDSKKISIVTLTRSGGSLAQPHHHHCQGREDEREMSSGGNVDLSNISLLSLFFFTRPLYVAKHCRKLSSGRLFWFYWVVHKLSNKNGFEHLSRGAQGESGRKKKGCERLEICNFKFLLHRCLGVVQCVQMRKSGMNKSNKFSNNGPPRPFCRPKRSRRSALTSKVSKVVSFWVESQASLIAMIHSCCDYLCPAYPVAFVHLALLHLSCIVVCVRENSWFGATATTLHTHCDSHKWAEQQHSVGVGPNELSCLPE